MRAILSLYIFSSRSRVALARSLQVENDEPCVTATEDRKILTTFRYSYIVCYNKQKKNQESRKPSKLTCNERVRALFANSHLLKAPLSKFLALRPS